MWMYREFIGRTNVSCRPVNFGNEKTIHFGNEEILAVMPVEFSSTLHCWDFVIPVYDFESPAFFG